MTTASLLKAMLPGNRTQRSLFAANIFRLLPNISFKPKPLRGSA
jgi:hypothetical protein